MDASSPKISPVVAPALQLPGIAHAFFTREGGVSTGLYAGLNTGIGSTDLRESVLENRRLSAEHLGFGASDLATPHQVHGAEAVVVETAWQAGKAPKVDALVTRTPGVLIGVGAADCGPVLFADPKARVVGAAHAGWKGAFSGVLEATLAAMTQLGAHAEDTIAVLGPTISGRAYEVGPEFFEKFITASDGDRRFFRPSTAEGHVYFDLPAYIVSRLHASGLGQALEVGLCTYSDEKRFFSFRRATHRGEPDYGRNLSAIGLTQAG